MIIRMQIQRHIIVEFITFKIGSEMNDFCRASTVEKLLSRRKLIDRSEQHDTDHFEASNKRPSAFGGKFRVVQGSPSEEGNQRKLKRAEAKVNNVDLAFHQDLLLMPLSQCSMMLL